MSNIVQGLVWNVDFPNPTAKIIALKLADNADDNGERIFPSIAGISRKTGCSRAAVYKWITAMEHCGLLKVVKRSAGGNPNERSERAYDLGLLRRLAEQDRKTPAQLKLRVVEIERAPRREGDEPGLFADDPRPVRLTVFEIVPIGQPTPGTDTSPARRKGAAPALAEDAPPVHQEDAPPVHEVDGCKAEPVHEVDGCKPQPVHEVDGTRPPGRRDPSTRKTGPVHEVDGTRPPGGHESLLVSPSVNPLIGDASASDLADGSSGGDRLIPFEETDADTTAGRGQPWAVAAALAAGKRAAAKEALGIDADHLPFSRSALLEVRRLCVDVAALIERYRERTGGKRVRDPSAYLVRMALEEVAKRHGVSVATAAKIAAKDHATRAKALGAAVAGDLEDLKRQCAAPRPRSGQELFEAQRRRGRERHARGARP